MSVSTDRLCFQWFGGVRRGFRVADPSRRRLVAFSGLAMGSTGTAKSRSSIEESAGSGRPLNVLVA
jgi:hypothetical protein